MKLEQVTRKDVSHVELQDDEKHSIGISIGGGTEDEAGPVVKGIKRNSSAARSFAIAKGDVILSVNGHSTSGLKRKDVRKMIKDARKSLRFELQYKIHEISNEIKFQGSEVYRKRQLTIKLKKVNGSFGFILRKKGSKYPLATEYPVISNIKEGSKIHKTGQFQDGDHLLMVDNVSLSWLSIPCIASILQEKSEAEFTFEYNVKVDNFPKGEEVNLEINVPIADIGLHLSRCDYNEECTAMIISSIRQGSVAERCGLFCKGDYIQSIDDVDEENLTLFKAYLLLRKTKQGRRISYITGRQREFVEPLNELSNSSSKDNPENCYSSRSRSAGWKHMNTPASSNFASCSKEEDKFQRLGERYKTVDNLRYVRGLMAGLERNFAVLSRLAIRGKMDGRIQNCTYCNRQVHSIKLCTACILNMNSKFARSRDYFRYMVAHFIRFSTNGVEAKENEPFNIPLENTMYLLTEALPKMLRDPELEETFHALSQEIAAADTSCNTCDFHIKTSAILAEQLFLVLSLRQYPDDNSDLVRQLIRCLLELKFTCNGESECIRSSTRDANNTSSSENLSCSESASISSRRISGECSPQSKVNPIRNNSVTESNETCNSEESNLNISQHKTSLKQDYLKLAHIPSLSESQISVPVTRHDSKAHSASLIEAIGIPLEEHSYSNSISSDSPHNTVKVIRKGKNLSLAKIWRSFDSFLRPSRHGTFQMNTPSESNLAPDHSKIGDSNEVNDAIPSTSFQNFQNHLLPNRSHVQNEDNDSSYIDASTSYSSRSVSERRQEGVGKSCTETIKVKISNNGDGFGLDIGLRDNSTSSVPVINSIKPKSPSQKLGVLKVGDRILAINEKSTSELTSKELLHLMKTALRADSIELTVEFDVDDVPYKFGTFDVVLDKTLTIGLVYEDVKKGSPMVVSGLVKGGEAHRSGKLFPRDRLKFFRYVRNEEFDPISCNSIKEENVIITVQREPHTVLGLPEKPLEPPPNYVKPRFYQEDSIPRCGLNFVVKSTSVRALDGLDSLVLDHEVTLLRDSETCDFGILLGKDQDTGCAHVTDIRPDGPAHRSGVIKKFDKIVEVNGKLVDRNVENSALDLFSQANEKVDLLIRRTYHEDLNSV